MSKFLLNQKLEVKILTGTAEKLVLFLFWLSIALIRPVWWVQLFLLVAGMNWLYFSVPIIRTKWKLVVLAASFIIMGTIGLIMVNGTEEFDAFYKVRLAGIWWGITKESLSHASLTAIKAMNGLLAIQYLIHSLSVAEGLALARFLRLPDIILELMMLSYRYLFTVRQAANEILMAQRQRLGYNGFFTSLKSFSLMLSALFVKSLRFSLMNYQAMTVRGYSGVIHQTGQWQKSAVSKLLIIILIGGGIVFLSYYV